VPSYAGPSASRSDDIAGTLRLLVALTLAIALMVLDHRGGWLSAIRVQIEHAVQPLWRLAGLPARLGDDVRDTASSRARLMRENETLRNALLISNARIARLEASAAENARLRGLLGAAEQGGLDVQLAPILDIALDPTRQRLTLAIGADQGVRPGQAAIDAGGLVGQVIDVRSGTATVLLLTDPDHAVPVAVARNGIRLVAYGRGDRIELANIPTSSDVKVGDRIVTSGLGGRFPPGFPVGTIVRLRRDESRAFLVGELRPAAQLDRGRDVLLLRQRPPGAPASVPTNVPANVPANVPSTSPDSAAAGADVGAASASSNAAMPATTPPVTAPPVTTPPSATPSTATSSGAAPTPPAQEPAR
jgi:rod shape-determining protein MreC